jgi:hypothetical protein
MDMPPQRLGGKRTLICAAWRPQRKIARCTPLFLFEGPTILFSAFLVLKNSNNVLYCFVANITRTLSNLTLCSIRDDVLHNPATNKAKGVNVNWIYN